MFTLRPAQKTDFPAIRGLIRKVGINPFGLDWRHFLVAVDEQDRVIASGQIKPHRDGTFELASIATEPAWRSQGIASAIIRNLLDRAPRPLYLITIAPTSPFYQRFGFRQLSPAEMPHDLGFLARLVGWLRRHSFPGAPDLVVMAVGMD